MSTIGLYNYSQTLTFSFTSAFLYDRFLDYSIKCLNIAADRFIFFSNEGTDICFLVTKNYVKLFIFGVYYTVE